MKIETLFEDDDLVIVNKPARLLVIPDRFNADLPSLNKLLEVKLKQKLWVVHRLDRDTNGVICFAKNEQTHRYLSILFQEHAAVKLDAGLLTGRVTSRPGYRRRERTIPWFQQMRSLQKFDRTAAFIEWRGLGLPDSISLSRFSTCFRPFLP